MMLNLIVLIVMSVLFVVAVVAPTILIATVLFLLWRQERGGAEIGGPERLPAVDTLSGPM